MGFWHDAYGSFVNTFRAQGYLGIGLANRLTSTVGLPSLHVSEIKFTPVGDPASSVQARSASLLGETAAVALQAVTTAALGAGLVMLRGSKSASALFLRRGPELGESPFGPSWREIDADLVERRINRTVERKEGESRLGFLGRIGGMIRTGTEPFPGVEPTLSQWYLSRAVTRGSAFVKAIKDNPLYPELTAEERNAPNTYWEWVDYGRKRGQDRPTGLYKKVSINPGGVEELRWVNSGGKEVRERLDPTDPKRNLSTLEIFPSGVRKLTTWDLDFRSSMMDKRPQSMLWTNPDGTSLLRAFRKGTFDPITDVQTFQNGHTAHLSFVDGKRQVEKLLYERADGYKYTQTFKDGKPTIQHVTHPGGIL